MTRVRSPPALPPLLPGLPVRAALRPLRGTHLRERLTVERRRARFLVLHLFVVICNTNQPPRWERGKFEGSLAVWPKGNNYSPGIAHITISGVPYSLPERCVRPHHPTDKGPVVVIDARDPRYCQQMVIVQFKKGGNCIVRPRGNRAYAKTGVNRFEYSPASLAVIVDAIANDW
ncbi:hypothetical protein H0H92_012470 [Tricholoma furcatifolium]|nr:hypothetical protein H0H92_012470 [Tricholoma furcatifolium]